ncbi:hypothetical protein [Williamsia maris]|uniref:hypothetical protein n=1 Tax=Williamsia maris TaxID=72806 RepID=UPI0020A37AC0|nr:hypothetical protein [Williamsia maris]
MNGPATTTCELSLGGGDVGPSLPLWYLQGVALGAICGLVAVIVVVARSRGEDGFSRAVQLALAALFAAVVWPISIAVVVVGAVARWRRPR